MKSQKLITKSDTKKKSPTLERKSAQKKSSDLLTRDYEPLENVTCKIGDNACAAKHVSVIQRTGLFRPMNKGQKVQSLLRLQQQYGNRFVQRVIAQHAIQTKLKIGQPGDKYEQEADRVAEMMLQRQCTTPECEEEEMLQMKQTLGPIKSNEDAVGQILQHKESGRLLEPETREFMESRFGYDFGDVRVHTDAYADKVSRQLGAEAFTVGRDVYFGRGRYNPSRSSGKRLLAHELTHVVQQKSSNIKNKIESGQLVAGSYQSEKANIRYLTGKSKLLQRSVSSDYPQIKSNLSYGLLDWAITDNEAREVLRMLEDLSDEDLIDTYFQMETDGLWSRLQSNIPDNEQSAFNALNERINNLTTIGELTSSDQAFITEICTFFFPDNPPDCINQEVAEIALEMVVRAKNRCSELMDIIPRPPAVPTLFWLLRQVGAPIWRRVSRSRRVYEACRAAVSYGFRSSYEIAQISCHT